MSQGLVYLDIDDRESVEELLAVTADEASAHDDRFDAAINAYTHCKKAGSNLRLGPRDGRALIQ
jgi:hypothetical protein